MRLIVAPLMLLASSAAPAPPAAVPPLQDQLKRCEDYEDKYSADQKIAACTVVIASNQEDNETRKNALAFRGIQYEYIRDYVRAISDFSEAIRLGDRGYLVYQMRGDVFTEMKDYSRAISDYDNAIRLDPRNIRSIGARGRAYSQLGNHRLALADYDLLAALGMSYDACWERAVRGTELDRARAYCDEAIRQLEKSPILNLSLAARGMVGLKQKRFQDAWSDYDAAIRLWPTDPDAISLFGRGIAALALGRAAEGRADIARARELAPKVAEGYARWGITPP